MNKKTSLKIFSIVFIILLVVFLMVGYLLYQTQKKSKAGGDSVTASFNPSSFSLTQNQEVTTILKIQPSVDMMIRGYYFTINFDKSKLELTGIEYRLGNVSQGLGDSNSNLSSVNQRGIIKIVGEIQNESGYLLSKSQQTEVVALTFKSLSEGNPAITIDTDNSKIVKINSDSSLSEVPVVSGEVSPTPSETTPTPTPSPIVTAVIQTPTPTETPTQPPPGEAITISLKLRFQGVLKRPADQFNNLRVKITVTGQSPIVVAKADKTADKENNSSSQPESNSCSQTANFVADDNGVWSGTISCDNLSAGSDYKILVKGEKHIQKRVCDDKPTETYPGTYHCGQGKIVLTSGVNNLDFSGIYLLVGDLPGQDGIVNSYDVSLVRNSLNKGDTDSLRLADLNLDGVVNAQDYSLVIAALSIRTDED